MSTDSTFHSPRVATAGTEGNEDFDAEDYLYRNRDLRKLVNAADFLRDGLKVLGKTFDKCPVCLEASALFVVKTCGHGFCIKCIKSWCQDDEKSGREEKQRGCPYCRRLLWPTIVIPEGHYQGDLHEVIVKFGMRDMGVIDRAFISAQDQIPLVTRYTIERQLRVAGRSLLFKMRSREGLLEIGPPVEIVPKIAAMASLLMYVHKMETQYGPKGPGRWLDIQWTVIVNILLRILSKQMPRQSIPTEVFNGFIRNIVETEVDDPANQLRFASCAILGDAKWFRGVGTWQEGQRFEFDLPGVYHILLAFLKATCRQLKEPIKAPKPTWTRPEDEDKFLPRQYRFGGPIKRVSRGFDPDRCRTQ